MRFERLAFSFSFDTKRDFRHKHFVSIKCLFASREVLSPCCKQLFDPGPWSIVRWELFATSIFRFHINPTKAPGAL